MNYYSIAGVTPALSGTITQARSFPFSQYISPTDYDEAAGQLIMQINLRYPGIWNFFNQMRYGIDAVRDFLDRYIIEARKMKSFITVDTFGKFKNALRSTYPEFPEDMINEYLTDMIELQKVGTFPDSILKPYNYVPDDVSIVGQLFGGISHTILSAADPLLNKVLMFATIGLVAYGSIAIFAPGMLAGIKKQARRLAH